MHTELWYGNLSEETIEKKRRNLEGKGNHHATEAYGGVQV
jgi:hypothetical protein